VQHEWREGKCRWFLQLCRAHKGGLGVQTTCIDVHITCFITTKAIKKRLSKSERDMKYKVITHIHTSGGKGSEGD